MISLPSWLTPWRAPRKAVDPALEIFREIFGGWIAKSGITVDWKTALQVTSVLACARVIAEGIAQVPFKLMQEDESGRTRKPARSHPLFRVLHRRPNPWQTSFEFRETIALHLVLCSQAFVFINRIGSRIIELIPFEPNQVTILRAEDGTLSYRVSYPNGKTQVFPAESIWHLKGPSWNGWSGMDVIKLGREAIGLAIATEEQHAKLHANGVRTPGVYSVEGTLSPEQYKGLRRFIKDNHTGENEGLPMILDRAAKWLPMALNGVDAQHLETRRHQVEEVCRLLRVMPIMIGHSDKATTYASAEQMFIAHQVHTLSPWYVRIEQSADVNLLTERDERAGLYCKFFAEGLLRGAMRDMADFLTRMTNAGIMTRNEAREKLELNPLDGLDQPLTPVNMAVGFDDEEDDGDAGGAARARAPEPQGA